MIFTGWQLAVLAVIVAVLLLSIGFGAGYCYAMLCVIHDQMDRMLEAMK